MARNDVPPSKNKSVQRLRRNWSWMVWPRESEHRELVSARWDDQSDSGTLFAVPEFWEALHTDHGDALSVLLQVKSEAEAFPNNTRFADLPEDIGAQLVPLDPVVAFKDEVNALLTKSIGSDPVDDSAQFDLTLRYAELRERLEQMQRAVLEAEGSLDAVRTQLSASGRTGNESRAQVQPA